MDALARAAEGGRMTTRKTLVEALNGIETILLDLNNVTPIGLSNKQVIKAYGECLWILLERELRREKEHGHD